MGQRQGIMNKDLISKLKSGSVLPDQLFGWSTKTVLAGLLALLIVKLKMGKKRE